MAADSGRVRRDRPDLGSETSIRPSTTFMVAATFSVPAARLTACATR
jgi:hypothetical protein